MRRVAFGVAMVAVVGFVAVGAARVAYAQAPGHDQTHTQATPKNFSYEIRDGKRVPKGHRTTNADGSWREETKVGNCTTIKESSAAGEVKITRKCD